MAIAYPLTLPKFVKRESILDKSQVRAFRESRIGIKHRQIINVSNSGKTYVSEQPGSKWYGSYTLPLMRRDEALQWQIFLEKLNGKVGTFYAYDDTIEEVRRVERDVSTKEITERGQIVFETESGWNHFFNGEIDPLVSYGQFPYTTWPTENPTLVSNLISCDNDIDIAAYLYGNINQNDLSMLRKRSGTNTNYSFSDLTVSNNSLGPLEFSLSRGDQLEMRLNRGTDVESAFNAAEDAGMIVESEGGSFGFNFLIENNGKRFSFPADPDSDFNVYLDFNLDSFNTEYFENYFSNNIELALYLNPGTVSGTSRRFMNFRNFSSSIFTGWTIRRRSTFFILTPNTYYKYGIRKTGERELTFFAIPTEGWQNTAQLVDFYHKISDTREVLINRAYIDIQTGFDYNRQFDQLEFLQRVNPPTLNSKVFRTSNHDVKIGDQFNIGETMHKAVQVEESAGELTVDFIPKLDVIPSTLPDVVFEDPRCIARLVRTNTDIIEDVNQHKRITIDWEEA